MNRTPSTHHRRTAVLVAVGILAVVGLAVAIFVDFRRIGPPSAAVSFETSMEGRYIRIDGTTDLPDGTILYWDLAEGGRDQPGGAHITRNGDTTTADGRFTALIPMPERYTGLVSIAVKFYPHDEQPPSTIERFGPDGQNLRGSGVYDDSGFPYLLVTREMTFS